MQQHQHLPKPATGHRTYHLLKEGPSLELVLTERVATHVQAVDGNLFRVSLPKKLDQDELQQEGSQNSEDGDGRERRS